MNDTNIIHFEQGFRDIKERALVPLENMLEEGLKRGKLFPNKVYSDIYTICYNMCTQKTPFNWSDKLYACHSEGISEYLTTRVVPALQALHDEQLLREFVRRASNHTIMNKWYAHFFVYLNRYHVRYHQLPSLSEAGLTLYKRLVYTVVKTSVTSALLRLIDQERNNILIDRDLVKKCCDIYETMGLGNLEAYEQDFERDLLEASKDFYSRQAAIWIASDSTPAYLVKVEKVLEDERQRVKNYLHANTESKLLQVVDRELLEKQLQSLLEKEGSGCRVLLQNNQLADLQRMYSLLFRINGGLEPMADIFKRHILEVGSACIERRLDPDVVGGEGGKEKESAEGKENEDAQFIKEFIAIHEKYQRLVTNQFSNHHLFHRALQDAFTELVNKDDLLGGSGGNKYKAAELMASFCDRLLRKNTPEKLSESETEHFLEQTVCLFMYISDKDFFAEVYRQQLAKRLLQQRSASDDMERTMIGKLKSRCGAQFTAKMEGMMNDLAIGSEQSVAFERFCKDNPVLLGSKMTFVVQILTTSHWPQYKLLNELTLPPVMLKCMSVFRNYYDNQPNNSKRKLTWVYSLGNVNIRALFGGFKKAYELSVSIVQAAVLLLFNSPLSVPSSPEEVLQSSGIASYSTLQQALNMPDDVLKKALHSLCCGKFKILKKISQEEVNKLLGQSVEAAAEGASKEDNSKGQIRKTDIFQFNDSFTCPTRNIRVPMALLDDNHSAKKVEEDRQFAIEAAIVRTMKARKQLSHQQLIAEVMAQLALFKPDPKVIKQRIEALIDRDYLERNPENPSIYRYLA